MSRAVNHLSMVVVPMASHSLVVATTSDVLPRATECRSAVVLTVSRWPRVPTTMAVVPLVCSPCMAAVRTISPMLMAQIMKVAMKLDYITRGKVIQCKLRSAWSKTLKSFLFRYLAFLSNNYIKIYQNLTFKI